MTTNDSTTLFFEPQDAKKFWVRENLPPNGGIKTPQDHAARTTINVPELGASLVSQDSPLGTVIAYGVLNDSPERWGVLLLADQKIRVPNTLVYMVGVWDGERLTGAYVFANIVPATRFFGDEFGFWGGE